MSYHFDSGARRQPLGFGAIVTLPDPAAGLSNSEKAFIKDAFKGDWSALTNGVTDAATGEAKQFLKETKLDFPEGAAADLVEAVQTVSRFFDGNISKDDMVALGKTLGEASAVVIGAAVGSVIPGLGTAIGTGVGLIVGALWNAFEDHTAELKKAAEQAKQSIREIKKNVEKWEDSVRTHAWIITANLAGDHKLVSDYEAMGLEGLTPKQRSLREKHLQTAMKFMLRFGFQPHGATYIAETVSTNPERRRYDEEHRCHLGDKSKGGWTCGLNRRIDWKGISEYTIEFASLTNRGYLDEGAVAANLSSVQKRMKAEARAMAVYEAYVGQLRTMADTLKEQAKKKAEALKAVTKSVAALKLTDWSGGAKGLKLDKLTPCKPNEVYVTKTGKCEKPGRAGETEKKARHTVRVAAAKHRAALTRAQAESARRLADATRKAADRKAAAHAEKAAAAAMREATKVEAGAEIPWGMVAFGVGVVGVAAWAWRRRAA